MKTHKRKNLLMAASMLFLVCSCNDEEEETDPIVLKITEYSGSIVNEEETINKEISSDITNAGTYFINIKIKYQLTDKSMSGEKFAFNYVIGSYGNNISIDSVNTQTLSFSTIDCTFFSKFYFTAPDEVNSFGTINIKYLWNKPDSEAYNIKNCSAMYITDINVENETDVAFACDISEANGLANDLIDIGHLESEDSAFCIRCGERTKTYNFSYYFMQEYDDFFLEDGIYYRYNDKENHRTLLGVENLETITEVTVPEDVTIIGENAFTHCSALTTVTLNDSIKEIKDGAFAQCKVLEHLDLPESLETIGYGAFTNCASMTINKLPDNLKTLHDSAFRGCSSIESINIPSAITEIEPEVFDECSSLKEITIPGNITKIGEMAFRECTGLETVTIEEGCQRIYDQAFQLCESLVNVTIPESVIYIGTYAFTDCTSLTEIKIPEGISTIAYGLFYNCENLTNVYLPSTITLIDECAFSDDKNLKNVYYNGRWSEWVDVTREYYGNTQLRMANLITAD